MNSATDLKAFADLRDASIRVTLEFQAKIIFKSLHSAFWSWKGSAYHILCAVEMLLKHGNEGLLNELLKPENMKKLAAYFDDKEHGLPIETQHLLAKHVYVRPYINFFQDKL